MKHIILVDNKKAHLDILKQLLEQNENNQGRYKIHIVEVVNPMNASDQIRETIDQIRETDSKYYIHVIIDLLLETAEENRCVINVDEIYEITTTGMQAAIDIKNKYSDIYGTRLVISLTTIYIIINPEDVKRLKGYPTPEEENIFTDIRYIRKPLNIDNEENVTLSSDAAYGCIDWELFKNASDRRTRSYPKAFCNIAEYRLDLLEEHENNEV